ncbi:MAG: helix-turn-helix domain-containing protein [Spirosomataceae bacterium]
MEDLILKIKAIRLKKGISQEQIAAKLNMKQSNYARLENGKTDLKLDKLALIADALEMSVGSLIDFDVKGEVVEDTIFYYNELIKANKKIEELRQEIEELNEESGEDYSKYKKENEKLNSEIKNLKEQLKNKEAYYLEIIKLKDELIAEKANMIEVLQELRNKK